MARPARVTNEVSNSSEKAYVYSTLTCGQTCVDYVQGGGDIPIEGRKVYINGGTGLANKNLITPLGVVTEIDANDIPLVQSCLETQIKAGFVVIDSKKIDIEKIVPDMAQRDGSAPLTSLDIEVKE